MPSAAFSQSQWTNSRPQERPDWSEQNRMTSYVRLVSIIMLAIQCIHYPTPGLLRTADGKPNLSAPAPRTTSGTPDLSGVWVSVQPQKQVAPNFAGAPG